MRSQVQQLPIEANDQAVEGLAESRRAGRDSVEHGLNVSRRARDDLEDLARCGLLIECRGQVAVPSLQLLEEAHVLDGDHGLVGESLEEGDLALAEGLYLRAPELD